MRWKQSRYPTGAQGCRSRFGVLEMRIGDYIFGKLGRGRIVADTSQIVVYETSKGLHIAEPIGDVRCRTCSSCGRRSDMPSKGWKYLDGSPGDRYRCYRCLQTRYWEKPAGWRVRHLKKCPACKKDPKKGRSPMMPSVKMGPSRRRGAASRGRWGLYRSRSRRRPLIRCRRCFQWR